MSWICYNQHLRADTGFRDQPGERSSVIAQSWLCCRCQVEESLPGEDRCITLTSSGHQNLSSVSAAVNVLLAHFFDYYFFCAVTLVQTLIIFFHFYMVLCLGFLRWLLLGWKVHVWWWADESRTPHLHPNPSSESSVPSLGLGLSVLSLKSWLINNKSLRLN